LRSLRRLQLPKKSLNIWFGYVKEELSCFYDGELKRLVGEDGGPSANLLGQADMVVMLELARRPAMHHSQHLRMDLDARACEILGGVALDVQMTRRLGFGRELVQVQQIAADDPDQSLLSVWYDPSVVVPGSALAHRNTFKGDPKACVAVSRTLAGPVNVTYDLPPSQCAGFKAEADQYHSGKSSLATSWTVRKTGERFAILGINLPPYYHRGKNAMMQRTIDGVEADLGVSRDRIFVLGDLNTRLLDRALGVGTGVVARGFQQLAELAEQSWAVVPNRTAREGDIEPCQVTNVSLGGFASTLLCKEALAAKDACRLEAVAQAVCHPGEFAEVAQQWQRYDSKRGAGGYDLVAKYFEFPPDREIEPSDAGHSSLGRWRLPTYRRTRNSGISACSMRGPFLSTCDANPCAGAMLYGSGPACEASAKACFRTASTTKRDVVPPGDPLEDKIGQQMIKPQVGWLDAMGYSRSLSPRVHVTLYQDRLQLTQGDHAPFVGAVSLDLGVKITPPPKEIVTPSSLNPLPDISAGLSGSVPSAAGQLDADASERGPRRLSMIVLSLACLMVRDAMQLNMLR